MIKRKITPADILYLLLVVIVLVMLINPGAKGLLIRKLMSAGFFQPDIPAPVSKKVLANPFNISFRDAKGQAINTFGLKGKVVFINFWATWCPPCIAEMPSVNQLYARFKNDPRVVFLIVDVDNDHIKAKDFLQKNNLNLPVYNLSGQIPDNIMDGTIPTTLVFDKGGYLIYRHSGAADYSSTKFVNFLSSVSR